MGHDSDIEGHQSGKGEQESGLEGHKSAYEVQYNFPTGYKTIRVNFVLRQWTKGPCQWPVWRGE